MDQSKKSGFAINLKTTALFRIMKATLISSRRGNLEQSAYWALPKQSDFRIFLSLHAKMK
jgi:hypothetical protein